MAVEVKILCYVSGTKKSNFGMKTRYQVGQKVWYVECYAYYNRGKKKNPSVWYRPLRAQIDGVTIEQRRSWNRKLGKHFTVKYHVRFRKPELNRGYQPQNMNIFADAANAWEYAKLTNAIVKLYPLPQEKRIPPTIKLHNQQKTVRKREPIEDTVY